MLKLLGLAAIAVAVVSPASADTYTKATFTGGVFGGNANVQSPFTSILTQGQSLTGTFVYDNNLIPGSGSGYVNVASSSFPATIGASDLFSFKLGSGPTLTAANEDAGAPFSVQYNNGHFNGFSAFLDFTYSGASYQADISGGTFQIYKLVNGNPDYGTTYVSGYINIGDAAVTNKAPFTPTVTSAVPEAATWAMMILGMGAVGFAMRRQKAAARVVYAA